MRVASGGGPRGLESYRLLAGLAVAVLAVGGGGPAIGFRLTTAAIYLGLVVGGLVVHHWSRPGIGARAWPLFAALDVAASALVVARMGPTNAPLLLLLALPILIWGLLRGIPGGLCAAGVAVVAEALLVVPLQRSGHPGFLSWGGAALRTAGIDAVSLVLLGAVSGLLGRRRRLEEALHRSTEAELEQTRLDAESIVAHLSCGLLCLDGEGRVTRFNARAAEIFGPGTPLDIGLTLDGMAASPGTQELATCLRGRLAGGREDSGELLLDASPVGVTTTPVRDQAGAARGLVVLLADLTERRAREEERRRRERLAYIGELSAGLAHEIRNSLKPITGSVELLRREIPRGEGARDTLMEIILREAESLENFLTEFLVFARGPVAPREVLSLETILGEELRDLGLLASGTFRLVRPPAEDPPLYVRADRSSLRQVLRNLGMNALQASGGGCELGWRRVGREAEISVRDHGPGIPEEIRERVFDPFFTTKPDGTGLGLAIARDLVDRLGGRLLLLPAEGGGTRASIRLPLAEPAESTPAGTGILRSAA